MIIGNVNYSNYYRYKDDIHSSMSNLLCEDVSEIIINYLQLIYSNELEELRYFRNKTHTIIIRLQFYHESFGFKFHGARNDKVGKIKMFGVFINDIIENSAGMEYMKTNNMDFRGFEVVGFNFLRMNGNGTLKNLKDYRKKKPCSGMLLKLRWNPELLKAYDYDYME